MQVLTFGIVMLLLDYIMQALPVEAASISWKQCADLPTKMSAVKSTNIEGKVYTTEE